MGFLDRAQQRLERAQHESSYSVASGQNYHYVVLQVTLKEKFIGPRNYKAVSCMDITQSFYDSMVSQYDKLFLDWDATTHEQANILFMIISDHGLDRDTRALDCAYASSTPTSASCRTFLSRGSTSSWRRTMTAYRLIRNR